MNLLARQSRFAARWHFGAFPEEVAEAVIIPKDCEARQGGTASGINWSTVSARTPNIKCPNTWHVLGRAHGGHRTRP